MDVALKRMNSWIEVVTHGEAWLLRVGILDCSKDWCTQKSNWARDLIRE